MSECPSRSCTILGCSPFASISVAAFGPNVTTVKVDQFASSFEALSVSFGMGNTVAVDDTGNLVAADPWLSEISIAKSVDKYTPKLQAAIASGSKYHALVVTVLRDSQVAARYTLGDVIFTGSSVAFGGAGTLAEMVESVSMHYGKINFSMGGQVFTWDTVRNTP